MVNDIVSIFSCYLSAIACIENRMESHYYIEYNVLSRISQFPCASSKTHFRPDQFSCASFIVKKKWLLQSGVGLLQWKTFFILAHHYVSKRVIYIFIFFYNFCCQLIKKPLMLEDSIGHNWISPSFFHWRWWRLHQIGLEIL